MKLSEAQHPLTPLRRSGTASALRADILRTPENKLKSSDAAGKVPKRRPLNLRRLRLPDLPRRALFVESPCSRHPAIHKRTDYKDGSFAAKVAKKLRFETTTTRTRVPGWKKYMRKQGEMKRKDRVGSAALLLEPVDFGYDPAEDSDREFGLYDFMNQVTGIHA